jgi:tetratricopeptide (TPR) repeat protein
MNIYLILSLLTIGGAYFSTRAPTQDELVASFQEAQGFYAEGAYDQAIAQYETVRKVRSRFLDAPGVRVTVGGEMFPVQEAAAYQIGNAYTKLYGDYTRVAEEVRDGARRSQYRVRADSAFVRGVASFRHVITNATNEVLRVQAHGRVIDLYFQAEKYPDVIAASQELIAGYPDDPRAIGGYYNRGWAYYEIKNYIRAIEAFETLLARFPIGYQADRSLFQIGECYLEMGEYLRAIDFYRRLIDRQRIQSLTEEEVKRMRREKLAGLVDETALELAAKAQIRMGTCYTKLGQYEEGVKAYQRVIALFSTERKLVEEAYLRMADLYQEQGDLEAVLQTYREAIDQSTDRTLKARIQYVLAEHLFSQRDYDRAIQEYRIYLKGYGDIAQAAGFPEGRVRYRIASAYQQLGQKHVEARDTAGAAEWLALAIAQYDTLYADPGSSYFLDAQFNRALAYQSLGSEDALARAQGDYEAIIQEARDGGHTQRALVQLGELHFTRSEYARAGERAQQLLDSFPGGEYTDDAHMRLALSRQAEGDLDRAVPAFLAVSEDSPHFARARLGGGHSILAQNKHTEAAQVLEEGLVKADDDAQRASFHYLLGQTASGQGDYRKALAHFSDALGYPLGRELEEALRFSRGNAAFLVEDYGLAEEDFRWIAEHVQEAEKIRSAENALALSYMKRGWSGAAIQTLADLVAEAGSPEEQADLFSRMMDLYYERDQYTETIGVARQLIALEFADVMRPGQSYALKEKAHFVHGDALVRLGRAAEAAEVFQEALRRYPVSYFARDMRLSIGAHYFELGELDQAKAVFMDLLSAGLDRNQELLVRFYLANTYYSLREFEDARRSFQDLLRDYPDARELPDILFGVAESHYQVGEFEKTIGYYERILEDFPDETAADDAQYNMAWCLIELKRGEEAMQALRTLLRRYPRSAFAASAQFTLGDYAYNRQVYQEAMAAYRKVLERYPDSPVAAQVPRLISDLEEAIAYQYYEQSLALMDSAEVTKNEEYFEQTIRMFQEIGERYPGTEAALGALSNMGVCLEGLGRWREAVEVYDRVIELYEEKQASKEAFLFAKTHRDWIVTTRL